MTSMLSFATTNKLRVSGPQPSASEITDTRRAVQHGRTLAADSKLTAIVWELFKEAMETHRRIPDRERGWLANGTRWPSVYHTIQERWEADLQRLIDLKMSPELAPLPRVEITDPSAIPRMLVVMGWLRYVKGKNVQRDKTVFLELAAGKPARFVRRHFWAHCADSTLSMTKDRVLRHISVAIGPYSIC